MSRWSVGNSVGALWLIASLGLVAGGAHAIEKDQALESNSFPIEKSARPATGEWEQAKPVSARVVGSSAIHCEILRVREWVRVSCPELSTAAVRLVSGEARNVYFFIQEEKTEGTSLPQGAYVEMAVRPSDQRIVEFWTFGPGYDGPLTVVGSLSFQQSWPKSESEPAFFLSDVLHEPIRTKTAEGK